MPHALHRFYGARDLHFLTFSCYRRQPLFCSATRCDLFLEILERARRRYRLVVFGYVVMPEHVHLLLSEPQRATLSTAIQALSWVLSGVRKSMLTPGKLPFPEPALSGPKGLAKAARLRAPQWFRTDSGRHGFTTLTFGRSASESRSFATFIAIRSSAGWWSHPNSGVGAVFVGIVLAKRARCASMIPRYW